VIVLLRLEAQQAHEMQHVRIIGIERESLLAAELRIEVSSGL
jgi:hypothetical protein